MEDDITKEALSKRIAGEIVLSDNFFYHLVNKSIFYKRPQRAKTVSPGNLFPLFVSPAVVRDRHFINPEFFL